MGNTTINHFDIEELETYHIILHDDKEYLEGEELLVTHLSHERNTEVVNTAKEMFKATHQGRLFCEVCRFDFKERYGDYGADFIEAHHIKPISARNKNEPTKVEEIVLLCSNCHSIVHLKQPWLSIQQIKQLLRVQEDK